MEIDETHLDDLLLRLSDYQDLPLQKDGDLGDAPNEASFNQLFDIKRVRCLRSHSYHLLNGIQLIERIAEELPNVVMLNVFAVDLKGVKSLLVEKASALCTEITQNLSQEWRQRNDRTRERFETLEQRLMTSPKSIEELGELLDVIATLDTQLEEAGEEIAHNDEVKQICSTIQ